jgi:hypothetical protein
MMPAGKAMIDIAKKKWQLECPKSRGKNGRP